MNKKMAIAMLWFYLLLGAWNGMIVVLALASGTFNAFMFLNIFIALAWPFLGFRLYRMNRKTAARLASNRRWENYVNEPAYKLPEDES